MTRVGFQNGRKRLREGKKEERSKLEEEEQVQHRRTRKKELNETQSDVYGEWGG